MSARFSKASVLAELHSRVEKIAVASALDRHNGTAQLNPKKRISDEDLHRAVQYGSMRALERLAEDIESGWKP